MSGETVDLTGTPGKGADDEDDGDRRPAAKPTADTQGAPTSKGSKKKVNPKLANAWKNIRKNVTDIAKGTLFTPDQVTGTSNSVSIPQVDQDVVSIITEQPWMIHRL